MSSLFFGSTDDISNILILVQLLTITVTVTVGNVFSDDKVISPLIQY